MLDVDAILRPWWDSILADARAARALRRPHPHRAERSRRVQADAGGAARRAGAAPARARSRSRCTSPTATAAPNDDAIAAAAGSDGRLVAVLPACNPRDDALRRGAAAASTPARAASSCTRAPSSSGWTSRRCATSSRSRTSASVPILIHAGRGIPALGQNTVELSQRVPGRAAHPRPRRGLRPRLALAACCPTTRTSSSTPRGGTRPTSSRCSRSWPAGTILWASDSPYGQPIVAALQHAPLRAAGRAERRGAALDHRRPDRPPGRRARTRSTSARAPGAVEPRAATRCWTASSPTSRPPWAARSAAPTRTSRSRSPAWPAPSATTRRTPTSAAPCSSCWTSTACTSPPPEPGRAFPAASRFLIAALIVARTPTVPLPEEFHVPPPTREEADT